MASAAAVRLSRGEIRPEPEQHQEVSSDRLRLDETCCRERDAEA